ncbi:hypothetical protein [Paracoccus sp. (in: a-proteobacteria)]|uniref:hypothetical protein n=1 Tax=Paracoccus sp. TaxID=267 RepID=UPI003220043A
MKRIWLIGCGNIGFRHLQAMLAMSGPAEITVIEPALALHPRVNAELALPRAVPHRVTLRDSLPEQGGADLAVVATSAPPRAGIVRALTTGRAAPRAVILEKVLAQTGAELDAIAADLAAAGVVAHVNCPRRYFPGYQALRTRLADQAPLSVLAEGAQFGLGSNAVHFLDLLEYLNTSPLTGVDARGLLPGGQPSKREGFQEIHGTLAARLENGAALRVTCADREPPALAISATTAEGARWHIDEAQGRLTGPDGTTEPFQTRFVSQTPEIYADALAGRCALTPLADSIRQHRAFLACLRQHFGLAAGQAVPVS